MSRSKSWPMGRINWALLLISFLPLLFGTWSQAQIIALSYLIIMAGACCLMVSFTNPNRATRPLYSPVRYPLYVAIPLGSGTVLIASILLRATINYHTFWTTTITLTILVVAVLCFYPRSPQMLVGRTGAGKNTIVAYVSSVALLALLFPAWHYTQMGYSAVYLTQGFDLFVPGKDPAEWPYFGEKFRMPLVYVTHTIGATFALFSAGDPPDFYLNGQYLLNIMLAPLVPIGGYLFFRRILPWWLAAIIAVLFCWNVLGGRLTSIRGETLGWMFGFAFLLVLDDFIRAARRRHTHAVRLALIVGILYFAMVLTHGIAALIATFAGAGYLIYAAFAYWTKESWLLAIRAACSALVLIGVLSVAYVYAFSPAFDFAGIVYDDEALPQPGEKDAALLFEAAIRSPNDIPIANVREGPPYVAPSQLIQVVAFLPVRSLYSADRTLGRSPLWLFPTQALDKLKAVSAPERITLVLLLVACLTFYLLPCKAWQKHFAAAFVISITAYFLLIFFCLNLNRHSVAVYPLAASQRVYIYIAFFYWLAVGVTTASILLNIARNRVAVASNAAAFLGALRMYKRSTLSECLRTEAHSIALREAMYVLACISVGVCAGFLLFFTSSPGSHISVATSALLWFISVLGTLLIVVIPSRALGIWRLRFSPKICRRIETATLALLISVLLSASALRLSFGQPWVAPIITSIAQRLGDIVHTEFGKGRTAEHVITLNEYEALSTAMNYVRSKTVVGEWVYTNIISDNQFWYLTAGRYSLLEGSAMYQLYSLQKKAAQRLRSFFQVMQTSDVAPLRSYGVKLMLLYKKATCQPPACFGYNVIPIAKFTKKPSPQVVLFENSHFIIYRID